MVTRIRRLLPAWLLLAAGCAGPHRLSIPPLLPAPRADILWHEPFDALPPDRWREVEVRRRTEYQLVTLEGRRCLEARSRGGASVLLSPVEFDADTFEWLSWDWRVDQLVGGEDLRTKGGSDAPARVYVYFDTHGLPWQKRSLDYVWSGALPEGTLLESAFSPQSKIIVAESGGPLGRWRHERRNIQEDYERCFGKRMPEVIAIGVMTDADNSRGEALAYFDNLRVSRTSDEPAAAAPADGPR